MADPHPGHVEVNERLVKAAHRLHTVDEDSFSYGNWRKPTSAGILGLGSVGTVILLGGLMLIVIVVMTAGLLEGVIAFAVLAVVMLMVVVKDAHGKSTLSRGSARVGWWAVTALTEIPRFCSSKFPTLGRSAA